VCLQKHGTRGLPNGVDSVGLPLVVLVVEIALASAIAWACCIRLASTCSLILRVISHLFVVIIKCRFDFAMVAMGEPHTCGELHPRKLHY